MQRILKEGAADSATLTIPPSTDTSMRTAIKGVINYIEPSISRVDANLAAGYSPPQLDPHEMLIRDARIARTTFENEGFEVHRLKEAVKDKAQLIEANRIFSTETQAASRAYQMAMLPLLKELSQAREVVPFVAGLVVRFSDMHADKTWQPAVGMVHIDMERTTVERFIKFAFESEGRELRPYRRAVVYQVWQPLSPPPHDSMMAFCDGRTVSASDIVLMDVTFGEGDSPADKFVSRGVYYNSKHQWYYFPDLQEDEVVVFKGFDTELGDLSNLGHCAFENPEGGIPRNSVECRFVALYD